MALTWLVLCLAAVAAGVVNAIAGGGTLLTFPTLQLALGTSVTANVTSTLALFPGTAASVWGYRDQIQQCRHWVKVLTLPSVLGGSLGSILLLRGGERIFRPLVPWLILAAAILFLLQPFLARALLRHPRHAAPSRRLLGLIILGQFAIGVYGGYFGAGIGILMLSSLSFLGLESIHQVNALKSYLAFCMNCTAAIIFACTAEVAWTYGLAMAVSASVGGYLGARWALRLHPGLVRRIVIGIGFGLAGYYFWGPA